MSWFTDLFHGGKDPSKVANNYLNQIPGATNPYYQPYINQGQNADTDLLKRYNDLLNNPGGVYNDLGKGYKESPGYQTRLQEALQSASNAQAAGGMAGSPQHQQLAAQKAVDLSGKDYEDYLNHIMGLYGQGLTGEQGVSTRGYNASTGYGDILGKNLGAEAQYGYSGQAGRNANQSNLFGNAIKFGASFIPGVGPAIAGGLNFLGNKNKPWHDPGTDYSWGQ